MSEGGPHNSRTKALGEDLRGGGEGDEQRAQVKAGSLGGNQPSQSGRPTSQERLSEAPCPAPGTAASQCSGRGAGHLTRARRKLMASN